MCQPVPQVLTSAASIFCISATAAAAGTVAASAAAANVHVMAFYTQKVLLSLVDCLFALQHHHVSSESRIQGQCHHKIPAQGSSAIRRDDRRPIWANNRLSEQIHQTYEVTEVELDAVENRFWCFQ